MSPESVRLEEIVVYFPSLDNIPLMMSKVDDEIVGWWEGGIERNCVGLQGVWKERGLGRTDIY